MPEYGIQSQHSNLGALAQALNSAADYQQTQQRLQQNAQQQLTQRQYENERQLQQQGAVPAEIENGPGNSSGFTTRAPNPAAQGGGQMVTEPISGKKWYVPTASEREQQSLNDSNSFVPSGQLADMLEHAGVKRGTRIKPSDSHSILQALDAAQMDEPYDIDLSGTFVDAEGNPAAVMIGKKTGNVKFLNSGGAQTSGSPGAAPGGPFDMSDDPGAPGYQSPPQQSNGAASSGGVRFAPPQKAEKPDVTQLIPGMQGPNGGPLIFDKTSQSMKEIAPVPGSKQVMTAAQAEADKDRHVRQSELEENRAARLNAADQARADKAQKAQEQVKQRHDAYQSAEQDQWDLHKRFSDLANPTLNPDGSTVSVPVYNAKTGEISDGAQRVMNAQLRGTMIDQADQAQRKAVQQHGYAASIRKSMGWGEFAKQQTQASPAAPAPAQPKPQAAAAAAPAKQSAPQGVTEGTVIVNRQTRQRQVWKGGKWQPLPPTQ